MSLIYLCAALLVIGVLLWAVTSVGVIAQPIKNIITAVVVVAVIFWLLSIFVPGFHSHDLRVP